MNPVRRLLRTTTTVLVAACAVLPATSSGTAAATTGTAAVAAARAGGRCADSPRYEVRHWSSGTPLTGLDVNVMACPWSTPDQWTVQAVPDQAGGGTVSHSLRAQVRNKDTTPTWRTVTVHVELDRCNPQWCERGIASWDLDWFLGSDGLYVTRSETVHGYCGHQDCDYTLRPKAAA